MIETSQRIRIIGGSGSGKTYLAQLISKHTNLNYINLDELYWSKKNKRNEIERNNLLNETMKNEKWIIEGSFNEDWVKNTLIDSTMIIILKVKFIKRISRISKRIFLNIFSNNKMSLKQIIKEVKESINYNKTHLKQIMTDKHIKRKAIIFSNADKAYNYFIKETAPDLFL